MPARALTEIPPLLSSTDGAPAPQEGNGGAGKHASPVRPREEFDERQPGGGARGLLPHLRWTGEPATQVAALFPNPNINVGRASAASLGVLVTVKCSCPPLM